MATINYLWDDETDTVVMETDENDTTTAVYQSDPVPYGRLRSMRRDGTTYNYHYDGRGNTTYLTDQTGVKTDTYTYTAFGNEVAKTGTTTNPYRFGGQHGYQYNTSTGDYYIRARTYEPKQSRWTSKDPLRFADWNNLYTYTGNEPVTSYDPTGHKTLCCVCRLKHYALARVRTIKPPNSSKSDLHHCVNPCRCLVAHLS